MVLHRRSIDRSARSDAVMWGCSDPKFVETVTCSYHRANLYSLFSSLQEVRTLIPQDTDHYGSARCSRKNRLRKGCGNKLPRFRIRYGYDLGGRYREMAKDRGLDLTRQNLEYISTTSTQENEEDYFMSLVLDTIRRNHWEKVAVSGIRTPADVRYLR